MKSLPRTSLILIAALLIGFILFAKAKTNQSSVKSKIQIEMDRTTKQVFIDKFLVPEQAIKEFKERSAINMQFIKSLPGFVKEVAYEQIAVNKNLTYITIVVWDDEHAVKKAQEMVQAEFKKQGFNPAEMMERNHITLDRGTYTEVKN